MGDDAAIFVKVPKGDCSEVGLIGALDFIVHHFANSVFPRPLDAEEVCRAVCWLHSKYGLPTDRSAG